MVPSPGYMLKSMGEAFKNVTLWESFLTVGSESSGGGVLVIVNSEVPPGDSLSHCRLEPLL